VVEYYDKGGIPNPHLSKEIKPLDLAVQEKADLVAFLNALSCPELKVEVPALPQ
jgi:cytochrome c peroxidase